LRYKKAQSFWTYSI